jgi:hypothetical protein
MTFLSLLSSTDPIARAGIIKLFGAFSQRQFSAIRLEQNNQMPNDVCCECGYIARRNLRAAGAVKNGIAMTPTHFLCLL